MQYRRVSLESIGYCLPAEVWTSGKIEEALAPLYRRLRLPEGRLELITGVRERRVWPAGTRPGTISIEAGRLALAAAQLDPQHVGALVHGSVCRDQLEPATACRVHHGIGLPPDCMVYDVSNACLGLLNGVLQVANMIELGQIKAGLVVGTEGSRQLLETTIDWLNSQSSLTRHDIKRAIASLTIGSASCALLLTSNDISRRGTRLVAASAVAQTAFHDLCRNDQDQAMVETASPLMWTDSERLLEEGIETGRAAFGRFLEASRWEIGMLDRVVCHQVGSTHQKRMLEALGLDPAIDYVTFPWLGNTGSVALPVTLAKAAEEGHLRAGHRVGLLGIGSGINSVMLACQWQSTAVAGKTWEVEQR